MARARSPADLARLQERFDAWKKELQGIGFILEGSVVRRWTACASPGCKCHADPPQRHGPYYDWTRRVKDKSVAQRLTPDQARVYAQWIENRKRFRRIVDRMKGVALQAARRVPKSPLPPGP